MEKVLEIKKEDIKQDIQKEVYSFDVFDTLITRKTALPIGIFSLMQETLQKDSKYELFPAFLKENFESLRINSERYAKQTLRTNGSQDISFDDVYKVIGFNNNLSEEQINELKELEIQTEIKNTVGIKQNINRVKELIALGKKVILISDMYHSSNTIRKLLINIDNIFQDIPIYVSSEYKLAKHTSDLYKKLQEENNINPRYWTHRGDNMKADIEQATKCGIKTETFIFPSLFFYENQLLQNNKASFIQYSLGASKFCRIGKIDNRNYCLGASFTGPMFFSYVFWILEQSIQRGIKRLYFVARDGFILKEIADIIIKKLQYDIETGYVYGSRDAWRVASLSSEDHIKKVLLNCVNIKNIEDFSGIVHLKTYEIEKLLSVQQKTKIKKNSQEFKKIAQTLLDNPTLKTMLLKQALQERESAVGYLKQTLNTDDSFAFVEYQGTGVTQDCLNRIIKTFYTNDIKTFYLSLDKRNQFNNESIKYIYFPNDKGDFSKAEVLLRALHGSTEGYKYKDNNYIPIINNTEVDDLTNWGFKDYLDGIKDYTSTFLDFWSKEESAALNDLSRYYFSILNKNDNKNFSEIIGEIPFGSGTKVKTVKKYAPQITTLEALKIAYFNKEYSGYNLNLSLTRSTSLVKKIFKFKNKYPKLKHFVLEIRISKKKQLAYVTILGVKLSFRKLLWRNQ